MKNPSILENLESRTLFASGDLDDSFSFNGRTTLDVNQLGDFANAIASLPNGKVLVAGETEVDVGGANPLPDIVLARFHPDGELDTSFGAGGPDGDGIVVIDLLGFDGIDRVRSMVVQPDGKFLIGGQTFSQGNYTGYVARFNADGSPDANFGSGGIRLVDWGVVRSEVNDLALQKDGKVLIAGEVVINSDDPQRAGIARLTEFGDFDFTFSGNGYAYYETGAIDELSSPAGGIAIAVQKNGKILLGSTGDGNPNLSDSDMLVFQFDKGGLLDTTFGDGGKVFIEFAKADAPNDDFLEDLLTQPNGDIVVAGRGKQAAAIAVLDSTGDVKRRATDSTFNGIRILSIARQTDNSIVALVSNLSGKSYVYRFAPDLELDETFNGSGIAGVSFGNGYSVYHGDLALAPDGNILFAGTVRPVGGELSDSDLAIARLIAYEEDDAAILGRAWVDHNGNGKQNSKDTGLGGVRVYIDLDRDKTFDAAQEPSILTLSNGKFTFPGLNPGTYRLRQTTPARFALTAPDPAVHKVVVSAGQSAKGNFFFYQSRAVLRGVVWEDAGPDFEYDEGDLGLEDFIVFIDENLDGIRQDDELFDTTDATGRWKIKNLNGGVYMVRVEVKEDYDVSVGPNFEVALEPGGLEGDLNFGLRLLDV